MRETISVIIPTYQHGDSIVACLESILRQSRQADEIIVVDDGSTDETKQILSSYLDRIEYLHQENAGAPAARMRGFKSSKGSLLLFCDADIHMHKDLLKELETALRDDPGASWAYCGFRWGWKRFRSRPYDKEALKRNNYIHTTSLIRRESFPGFDHTLKRFQDWDLWLTMSEQGHRGTFVDKELFRVIHQRVREHRAAEQVVREKHRL